MENAPKNVQIPYELFKALLDTLEYVDVQKHTKDFQNVFKSVSEGLQDKQKRIELRDDYSRLVVANKSSDEDKQHEARIEYLKKKNNHF